MLSSSLGKHNKNNDDSNCDNHNKNNNNNNSIAMPSLLLTNHNQNNENLNYNNDNNNSNNTNDDHNDDNTNTNVHLMMKDNDINVEMNIINHHNHSSSGSKNNGTTTTSCKRNNGRAARQRYKKKMEIQKQSNELLLSYNNNNNNNNMQQQNQQQQEGKQQHTTMSLSSVTQNDNRNSATVSMIPKDRNLIWPSVYEKRALYQWQNNDEILLLCQLGYIPGNVIRICYRVQHLINLYPNIYHYIVSISNHEQQQQNDQQQQQQSHDNEPIVIQLYPLAIRDENQTYKHNKKINKKSKAEQTSHDQIDIDDNNNNSIDLNGISYSLETNKTTYDNKSNNNTTLLNDMNTTITSTIQQSTTIAENNEIIHNNNNYNNETTVKVNHSNDITTTTTNEATNDVNNYNNNDSVVGHTMNMLVEPFPTIYWLTHPILRTLISQLEVDGYGMIYTQRLLLSNFSNTDNDNNTINVIYDRDNIINNNNTNHYIKQFYNAHYLYGKERYDILTKNDIYMIYNIKHWDYVFDYTKRGVAGIRYTQSIAKGRRNKQKTKLQQHHSADNSANSTRTSNENNNKNHLFVPPIKCLHTHAAHYLSGCYDNIVGRWVMEEVEKRIIIQQQQQN